MASALAVEPLRRSTFNGWFSGSSNMSWIVWRLAYFSMISFCGRQIPSMTS
jgi:hypothetical protein